MVEVHDTGTSTTVGAPGGPTGVAAFEGVEVWPEPMAFVATTVKV